MTDEELKKQAEEAAKPFNEKKVLVEGYIDEIKAKVGDEKAAEISQSLLGLQNEVNEATTIHTTVVVDNIKTKAKNAEILATNQELYTANSKHLKSKHNANPDVEAVRKKADDDPLKGYAEEFAKG